MFHYLPQVVSFYTVFTYNSVSYNRYSGSKKDRSGLALPLKSNPLKRRHRQSSESKSKKRPCRLRLEPNQNQISRCSKSDPITPIEG